MKKFLTGLSIYGAIFAIIYGLGVFRQFLENTYNDGYGYSLFLSRRFTLKNDGSIIEIFGDGIFTLILMFFVVIFLAIVVIFLAMFVYSCYKLGDNYFKKTTDEASETDKT